MRTLWGGGALEPRDFCLFKNGSERGGALVLDVVPRKTAGEGRSEDGERAAVSRGADRKVNTRGLVQVPSGTPQRLQRRVALEALGESGASLRAESVLAQTASMGARGGC